MRQEADGLPEIADAWLRDHLLPINGSKDGQILEGWTLRLIRSPPVGPPSTSDERSRSPSNGNSRNPYGD